MLGRLKPYWRHARRDTIFGVALLAIAAGIELLHPWPIKWVVDHIFGSQPAPAWLASLLPGFADHAIAAMIVSVCVTVVLLAVMHRAIQLISQYLLIRAGGRIVAELRCRVCEHLHRLSLTYHDKNKVGDSIYRAAYDTTAALSLVSQALAPAITGVLVLIGVLFIMFRLDPLLTVVSVAVAPCFFVLIRAFGRRIEASSKAYHERETELVSTLQESLSSIRAVQAFSREPHVGGVVTDQTSRSLGALKKQVFVQLLFGAAVGLAMALGTAAVLGVGAWRVTQGRLTIGEILVFLAYMGMLYQPMNAFCQSASVVHSARSQLKRVFEVLDMQVAISDQPDAMNLENVRGRVTFENVSFAYSPEQPVLQDVSLDVEPGRVIALVGSTGAGKTTMASMLLRFYDPEVGSIKIDGHDVRSVTLTSLRERISVVLQDAILFSASIANNIAYSKPGATREEIEQAARRAQIHDYIAGLPQGYDTMLGERGVNLSGGQRQRIAIARAFLKDAPILIMDEPTSALDAQTEAALLEAMRSLMQGRTTFIIAHRFSTVRLADMIVVLDQGRIVERGTHEKLLSAPTCYRRMYDAQRGDFDDDQAEDEDEALSAIER